MTLAVDWAVKPQHKQTKQRVLFFFLKASRIKVSSLIKLSLVHVQHLDRIPD